ncbi:hypothetical protein DFH07DRAFT_765031 [Mycena maculata]|uniref:Uncharacterized protein n=1 Tax=Mycena maculata TaxID=230809 RepID=A0AAD7P028_9AGAR|nr:hypothetical protein DFH07DRAFT_765031 [Mycena maculata]
MQRSTLHLCGSISLPTSLKLLSDPYKYDYQRRCTKSTKLYTACPDAVWSPPSAEQLERLVSKLENIWLFEAPLKASSHSRSSLSRSSGQPPLSHPTTSRSSASSKSASSSVQSTPPRTCKRETRNSSSQKPHSMRCLPGFKHAFPNGYAQARCPHGFTQFTLSPGSFKRSLHGFKPVCPHGYSQAVCAIHAPAQTTPACLPCNSVAKLFPCQLSVELSAHGFEASTGLTTRPSWEMGSHEGHPRGDIPRPAYSINIPDERFNPILGISGEPRLHSDLMVIAQNEYCKSIWMVVQIWPSCGVQNRFSPDLDY